MSFDSLGLSRELHQAITAQGYTEATAVQSQAIPLVLQGKDLLAGAQTGTGKTAAFTLPLLQRLTGERPQHRAPRALVLTPTRELAAQVQQSVRDYGAQLPLRSTAIFGGVGIQPQIKTLHRGVDILVATPGRLLDHVGQQTVDLSKIEILVLDEADRMLDMGFIHDIRKVLAKLPAERQNLLFSATFSQEIRKLADGLLTDPSYVDVAPRNSTTEQVSHQVHPVAKERKRALLAHLIDQGDWRQVLVFARTKHGSNRLAEQLTRDGLTAAAIHGNKSQTARTRALNDFKHGHVRVLVATDIAARGLDIEKLPHVVNFELSNVAEDYVHRIGRTGRAGETGQATSLVSADERKQLNAIERLLGQKLPSRVVEGFEPDFTPTGGRASDAGRSEKPQSARSNGSNAPKRRSRARSTA